MSDNIKLVGKLYIPKSEIPSLNKLRYDYDNDPRKIILPIRDGGDRSIELVFESDQLTTVFNVVNVTDNDTRKRLYDFADERVCCGLYRDLQFYYVDPLRNICQTFINRSYTIATSCDDLMELMKSRCDLELFRYQAWLIADVFDRTGHLILFNNRGIKREVGLIRGVDLKDNFDNDKNIRLLSVIDFLKTFCQYYRTIYMDHADVDAASTIDAFREIETVVIAMGG